MSKIGCSKGKKISYRSEGLQGFIRKKSVWCFTFEPGHEKVCLMSYANNKGADQPARMRSLISAFVVCCLDSIKSLDSIAEISRL